MAATGVWVTYTVDPESTHITAADGAAVHVEDRYTVREIHSSEIAALRATQRDSAPSKLVRAIHVPFGANVADTIRAQARPSAADQPREAPTKTRTSNPKA